MIAFSIGQLDQRSFCARDVTCGDEALGFGNQRNGIGFVGNDVSLFFAVEALFNHPRIACFFAFTGFALFIVFGLITALDVL